MCGKLGPEPTTVKPGIFLALLSLVLLAAFLPAVAAADVAGKAMFARNVARVVDGKSEAVSKGDALFEGDKVRVGHKGRLMLEMVDGKEIYVGQNTEFLVKNYGHGDKGGEALILHLVKGALRVITDVLGQHPGPDFQIQTPLAAVGVRGTDFWVGMSFFEEGKAELALISGGPVYMKNEAGQTVLTDAGTGCGTTGRTDAPTPPKSWPEKKFNLAIESVEIDRN